ncbi:MAG TPA: hypothetical protein VG872_13115 [Acidimicrobiia bacterium]|jgi:hypothetical protein|nr:hypothetical protein [Acidimicrobiia bacterium]
MQAKNVLYAAVGAPVVAARKVGDQVATLRGKVSKEAGTYTEAATKAIDDWAAEGEKIVTRISEGKVVEEISQKVDFDQAKEQVSKLRDQLEDMLATWRSSFRPEREGEASETAPASAAKPATTKPAAKQTATKKPAAKKPAAKASAARTTKSSSAAKKSPAKSTAAKAKTS